MGNTLKTETKRLWCKLSEEELQGLSQELAQCIQDAVAEEERGIYLDRLGKNR